MSRLSKCLGNIGWAGWLLIGFFFAFGISVGYYGGISSIAKNGIAVGNAIATFVGAIYFFAGLIMTIDIFRKPEKYEI